MKKNLLRICMCLLSAFLIASCARNPASPTDPYEKFNRFVFGFNMGVDKVVLRPVAVVYSKVTPPPIQTGVTNFFANLDELTTFPNDILQGKINWAILDIWRFAINSTFGIGGLIDVATHIGLPKHYEDFGMTLAYWDRGRHPSPYLMIPLLGPSTFRAAFGRIIDTLMDPISYIRPIWIPYTRAAAQAVSYRAALLPADKLMREAFDPYIFLREAYLQNRRKQILRNEMILPIIPPSRPENVGQYKVLSPVEPAPPDAETIVEGPADIRSQTTDGEYRPIGPIDLGPPTTIKAPEP